MLLSAAAKNAMLDAIDEAAAGIGMKFMSAHTAYSATGTNEVTGGSPAYARKASTFGPASAGSKALTSSVTFDIPAGTTVAWLGEFDASTVGNFVGMTPLNGGALKPFALDDTTADTIKSSAHGYTNGKQVVFWGASIPSDVAQGTIYYVVNATTDTFQVSTTLGGSAVNFTAKGQGFTQSMQSEVFGAQGNLTVSTFTVDLGAVA